MSDSKLYQLKEDDDIREIRLTLTATEIPVSAILVISKGSLRIERDLVQDPDDDTQWTYRFEDDDFLELVPSSVPYKAEVYATFSDGTNGTYPTVGTLQIRVYARL